MSYRKKLIEVALPLDAINAAAAREKSIRHGHPSTLHLWWARRPLAAARAVIFAQLVDDPSEYVDELRREPGRLAKARERVAAMHRANPELPYSEDDALAEGERNRIFALIEELVLWENTTNEPLLERARAEIRRSWARQHLGSAVASLTNRQIQEKLESGELPPLPGFHDPFAGGGALPLEAQRLGLEAWASDLNPVAVLINKAMIEIPPKFAGLPPVNPESRQKDLGTKTWRGAEGLAEDVRYYGQWMRDEAYKRIGHLYPPVKAVKDEDGHYRHATQEELDNPKAKVEELTVIAWIWARTVKSSDPAFRHVDVPLISTYVLSSKKGKEAWLEPIIENDTYRLEVRHGKFTKEAKNGTKLGRGANFRCILSDTPLEPDYIKSEGRAGRMGYQMMAIVCSDSQGKGKFYLDLIDHQSAASRAAKPEVYPTQELSMDPRHMCPIPYGLDSVDKLFTDRQLFALKTFYSLCSEVKEFIKSDLSINEKLSKESRAEYIQAIQTYLVLSCSRYVDYWSTLNGWQAANQQLSHTFTRNDLPMVWDFCEANPFSGRGGGAENLFEWSIQAIPYLGGPSSFAVQQDAAALRCTGEPVISTDPPYYDNVPYADLSDIFYSWMTSSLRGLYPELMATVSTPKDDELVASSYRHDGKEKAESYFLSGMSSFFKRAYEVSNNYFPLSIYYAFKQSEKKEAGDVSTGWETFIQAVLRSGFSIRGTWPMRSEMRHRMRSMSSNALASSIVLVCRKRPEDAGTTTRRAFQVELRRELPEALRELQKGHIAPVDLAQSAIGPGMAVFSRYEKVIEADGTPMSVRAALALINQVLDETLAEQEGELDPESRWAVAWYDEFGYDEAPFGRADDLARAKGTAVNALQDAGIVESGGGKVNLLRREEMADDWDPRADKHLVVWEAAQQLIRSLENDGEVAASKLLAKLGAIADFARDLAYRLYVSCERKGRAEEARSYNGLVIAWPELQRLAAQQPEDANAGEPDQGELEL